MDMNITYMHITEDNGRAIVASYLNRAKSFGGGKAGTRDVKFGVEREVVNDGVPCESGHGNDHLVHITGPANAVTVYNHCPHTNTAHLLMTSRRSRPDFNKAVAHDMRTRGVENIKYHPSFERNVGESPHPRNNAKEIVSHHAQRSGPPSRNYGYADGEVGDFSRSERIKNRGGKVYEETQTEALVKKDDAGIRSTFSIKPDTCFHCGKTGPKKVIELENKHYNAKAIECKDCSIHVDHVTRKEASAGTPIHPSYGENMMHHIKYYIDDRPNLKHVSSNSNVNGFEGTGKEEVRTVPHPETAGAHLSKHINIIDRNKLTDPRGIEDRLASFEGDIHKIKTDMSKLHKDGNIVRTNRFAAKDLMVREGIKNFYLKMLKEGR
jgi:hypothetical protein